MIAVAMLRKFPQNTKNVIARIFKGCIATVMKKLTFMTCFITTVGF